MSKVNPGTIFLGALQSGERKFLRLLLTYLRNDCGYAKLIIPCSGQLSIAACAIDAGYKPTDIYASDISLYSCLLGYLLSGQAIELLDFRLQDIVYQQEYETLVDEKEKVAYLYILMKLAQLGSHGQEGNVAREIMSDMPKYRKQIERVLDTYISRLNGIHFEKRDMRDYFDGRQYSPETLFVVNPPLYPTSYTTMFSFDSYIDYKTGVPEFDFGVEAEDYYFLSREEINVPFIWHMANRIEDKIPTTDKIYAREYKKDDRRMLIAITTPELIGHLPEAYTVIPNYNPENVVKMRLWDSYFEYAACDKCQFAVLNKDTGLYYRDLFGGKPSLTLADTYIGFYINGALKGVLGLNSGLLRKMEATHVSLNFCFVLAGKAYTNEEMLPLYMLLTEEGKKWLLKNVFQEYQYVKLEKLQTSIISDNAEGDGRPMERIYREELHGGKYRILYEEEFAAGTDFKGAYKAFLQQLNISLKK